MLIAEDLLLLVTDERSGRLCAPREQVDIGLAGANLLELTLMRKVDLSGDNKIVVCDPASTGDPVLDGALEILAAREGSRLSSVIRPMRRGLRPALYGRLAETGVLRAEHGRILGVFPARRWRAADAVHAAEARRLVTQALVQQTIPDTRTSALIALLHALKCEHKVVDPRPYGLSRRALRARAAEIAASNWATDPVRAVVEQTIAAVVRAIRASQAASASAG